MTCAFCRVLTLATLWLLLLISSVQAIETYKKVVLQLHWKHQFEFAGYYAAEYKGYFKDEGLDVEIKQLSEQTSAVEQVLSGAAQYGTSPSGLILDRMQGKPLVLLANDLKSSPLVLLASAQYTDLSQLKGKRVMGSHSEAQNAEIVYMLKANGIEVDDLEWIEHTFDTQDILNNHAAAMTAYLSNQPYQLFRQNIPYTVFAPRTYGINFYGNFLFTSRAEVQYNPQRVKLIMRASKKGWEYALQNPEEIIDYIMANYPILKSRDTLRFEATEINKLVASANCPVGSIDPQRVENIAGMFTALGMARGKYDLSGFISTEAELCKIDEDLWRAEIAAQSSLQLSAAETAFLKQRETLSACTLDDWPPYAILDEQGKLTGMNADILTLIAKAINKPITPVITQNWLEYQEYVKARKCDMIVLANISTEKRAYLSFSEPLLQTPMVIIGRTDQDYRGNLEALSGKKLALFKGHEAITMIRQRYPNIKLVLVDSLREALQKVHDGEVDATLCALASFVSSVSMMGLPDLEVIGGTGLTLNLAVGIRNDEPELAAIIQKTVNTLGPKKVTAVINRWLNVHVEKRFEYKLFWQFFVVTFIGAALLLYRHWLLSRHHKQLYKAHQTAQKEKIRAQEALQAEHEAIDSNIRFVDMISHEYRTPLSIISANLDILEIKTEQKPNDISTNLNKMRNATAKLVEIIETALDRDRLVNDKLIANKKPFVLQNMITETLAEVRNSHQERSLISTASLEKEVLFTGDAAMIKIMLRNLLENAFKYSPHNEVVSLAARQEDEEIILTVEDHGRGIPKQDRQHIFTKFHRAANTTDVPGAGIGLHMVKTIVNQHDGQIEILSPAEGGTIFVVHLPVKA